MSTEVLGFTAKDGEQPSWIPDDAEFGARLALVRWRMGWNVKEAAAACGLPAASWRLWEIDGSQPRNLMIVARKIAERSGCNLGWLVGGQELRGQTPYSERPTDRPRAGRPPNRRNGPSGRGTSPGATSDTRRPMRRTNGPSLAPMPRVA